MKNINLNPKEIKRMATNYSKRYGDDAIERLRNEAKDWAAAARENDPIDEEFMRKALCRREAVKLLKKMAKEHAVKVTDIDVESVPEEPEKFTDILQMSAKMMNKTMSDIVAEPEEPGDSDFNKSESAIRYKQAMSMLHGLEKCRTLPIDWHSSVFAINQDIFVAKALGYTADWDKIQARISRIIARNRKEINSI